MENLTGLLCVLFALVAKGRVTLQNLRRFVECPERLDDDWGTATVEEHLARIAANPHLTGTFGNFAPHLREDMTSFARATTPSSEQLSLMIARTGFALSVEHGLSLHHVRWWCDGQKHGAGHDPLTTEQIRANEYNLHAYRTLLDITTRLLDAQSRVSPFELMIEFDNGMHALEIIGECRSLPREYWADREHNLRQQSDAELQHIADEYWAYYLGEARRLLQELEASQ